MSSEPAARALRTGTTPMRGAAGTKPAVTSTSPVSDRADILSRTIILKERGRGEQGVLTECCREDQCREDCDDAHFDWILHTAEGKNINGVLKRVRRESGEDRQTDTGGLGDWSDPMTQPEISFS